jgi:hypothetical protein
VGAMISGLLRGTNPITAADVELLHERIVPFELGEGIIFDLDVRRAQKEQGVNPKDWTHLYVSPTRPLYPKHFPDDAVVNVEIDGEQVGLLYTNELLPVSDVEVHRLLAPPDAWKDALAKLAEFRGKPVELAVDLRKGEREVYLLFRNPRGIWQLSNFDSRGPIGHAEGKTAVSAVKNGLDRRQYVGFKLDAGLLDRWAPDFTFTGRP